MWTELEHKEIIPPLTGIRIPGLKLIKPMEYSLIGHAKQIPRTKVSFDMCTYFVITETELVDAVEFG